MRRELYFTPTRVGVFSIAVAIGVVLSLTPFRGEEQFPALGEAAPRTITVDGDVGDAEISYLSDELTAQARADAADATSAAFAFDPDVRPAQLEALNRYLAAVRTERAARAAPIPDSDDSGEAADDESTQPATPMRIEGSRLSERDERHLIAVSERQFLVIGREAQALLDDTLQGMIHEADIDGIRLGLADRVDPLLSLTESTIAEQLAAAYLRVTMAEDPAATERAQTAARPPSRPSRAR